VNSSKIYNSSPTLTEIRSCDEADQIVAVGATRKDSRVYLRFVFGTGDTEVVFLDEAGTRHLVLVLKTLVPEFSTIGSLGVKVDLKTRVTSVRSP
jgi:hypothetical protein